MNQSMPTDYEMFLRGNEDGDVEIICTHPSCMRKGETTAYNPAGLWLQDVGGLPYMPTPHHVLEAWNRHMGRHERPGGAA